MFVKEHDVRYRSCSSPDGKVASCFARKGSQELRLPPRGTLAANRHRHADDGQFLADALEGRSGRRPRSLDPAPCVSHGTGGVNGRLSARRRECGREGCSWNTFFDVLDRPCPSLPWSYTSRLSPCPSNSRGGGSRYRIDLSGGPPTGAILCARSRSCRTRPDQLASPAVGATLSRARQVVAGRPSRSRGIGQRQTIMTDSASVNTRSV